MRRSIYCSILCLAVSPLASGGQLILSNGDNIEGELVKIQGEDLVWQSPIAGEIKVKTSLVESVQTAMPLKLDGHEEPCYWLSVREGRVLFQCDDGEAGSVDLMALSMVIPHQKYAGGDYSYRGKVTVSGRQSEGNKQERLWAVDSEALFRRGDYRHESKIEYDSISQNDEAAESRGKLRYSLDWFLDENWFWYNNLQYSFDQPANIDQSYVVGSGIGYQIWENTISSLSVETGFDYVKESFSAPDGATAEFRPDNETTAWRWALDFRYLLPRNSAFFHRHQLMRSVEDSTDWLLETETGLSMPLSGNLYTELKVEYDVDNLPVEGTLREDKQVTVGVGYSW